MHNHYVTSSWSLELRGNHAWAAQSNWLAAVPVLTVL